VRKAYSDFRNLHLSNFFAIYNSFIYSFICCGTRGWRNFHDLQLINKATTYNTFLGEVNPPILWRARLTAIFTACKCQRISLFTQKKAGTALMHDTCFDVCIWIS